MSFRHRRFSCHARHCRHHDKGHRTRTFDRGPTLRPGHSRTGESTSSGFQHCLRTPERCVQGYLRPQCDEVAIMNICLPAPSEFHATAQAAEGQPRTARVSQRRNQMMRIEGHESHRGVSLQGCRCSPARITSRAAGYGSFTRPWGHVPEFWISDSVTQPSNRDGQSTSNRLGATWHGYSLRRWRNAWIICLFARALFEPVFIRQSIRPHSPPLQWQKQEAPNRQRAAGLLCTPTSCELAQKLQPRRAGRDVSC